MSPVEQPSSEKPKLRERAKQHATKRRSFELPHWALYVAGGVIALFMLWAVVNQFRVWRWGGLMKKAKGVITKLQERKHSIKYRTTKELTDKNIKTIRKDSKKADVKLKKAAKRKQEIKKEVDGLSASSLLDEFKKEGF